jgi:chemotaxis protein methyltransferase CheR
MRRILSESLLEQFSGFVEYQMGLSFPKEKWNDLERGVQYACKELGCDNEETFARNMMTSPLTKRQIEILAGSLTVGETYFFREKIVLEAFEYQILPELIRLRRGIEQHLRIWSAGCSSGEEPYTIAVILKSMLADIKDWGLTLLATDINPISLEKAAKGFYTKWSFRDVPEWIMGRYFTNKGGNGIEILSDIKKMVAFSYLNLMKDDYPSLINNTNAMDVIFCRNVLIYFAPENIKKIAQNFHRSLIDGGWLIVSQTELIDEYFPGFEKINIDGAILYRKARSEEKKEYVVPPIVAMPEAGRLQMKESQTITLPLPLPSREGVIFQPSPLGGEGKVEGEISKEIPVQRKKKEAPPAVSAQNLYKDAKASYEQGKYRDAKEILNRLLSEGRNNAKALSLMSRICANEGKLDDAFRYCGEAIEADNLNPGYYYLQSAIFKEKGLAKEAMESLKKAVYLDSNFALAYFAMGNLALSAGNRSEAEKHFNNALLLLKKHRPEEPLPESDGMTAERLIEVIEAMKWRKKDR